MKNKTQQNNYAFIDSQNLNLGVKSTGWNLDFKKFRIYLRDKFKVSKAFLFIGYIPKQRLMYKKLESMGYDLIFKPIVIDDKHKVKGNIDAELVLHTMIELPNFDLAVIVSGDGDFYCLINYLIQQGKLAKIITPTRRYSSLLKSFSEKILLLELVREKLELK